MSALGALDRDRSRPARPDPALEASFPAIPAFCSSPSNAKVAQKTLVLDEHGELAGESAGRSGSEPGLRPKAARQGVACRKTHSMWQHIPAVVLCHHVVLPRIVFASYDRCGHDWSRRRSTASGTNGNFVRPCSRFAAARRDTTFVQFVSCC